MAWENARDYLLQEMAAGTQLPVEHSVRFTSGPNQGKTFKVIVLPPEKVTTLSIIRKGTRMDEGVGGVDTINFAPAGGCPVCGR